MRTRTNRIGEASKPLGRPVSPSADLATADDETTKNKQQLRTERSTHALLGAAADLIAEGGPESLTFAAVGERAGYSRGPVTARLGEQRRPHRSPDRPVRHRMGTQERSPENERQERSGGHTRAHRLDSRPGREESACVAGVVRADVRSHRTRGSAQAAVREVPRGFQGRLATYVNKGRGDGSIRKEIVPCAEAALLVGGLSGIAYQWLLDPSRFDPVAALEYLRGTTHARLRA